MSPGASQPWLRFILAGCLNRDFILPVSGSPQLDILGGNLAYAAVGLHLSGASAGMVARIGRDFPKEWLDPFEQLGFDLSGIKILPESIDLRRFMAHDDPMTTHDKDPIQQFAERGLPIPPELLGYQADGENISSRTTPLKQSLKFTDIPESYLDASAVHICPIDYLSHLILPSIFHQGQASTITLTPAPGYMNPSFWEEIPGLLSDITAFIVEERQMRELFQGRRADLWEMAEVLGKYGPELILIRTLSSGCYLYDRLGAKRWVIPNYRTDVVDPTGGTDAFAGGFLAGYREDYDPVGGAVMGSIAASMVVEGSGVFYAFNSLPGLMAARRSALQEFVREI